MQAVKTAAQEIVFSSFVILVAHTNRGDKKIMSKPMLT